MEIEYEPRFVEEAVLRAIAARPEGRLFHRERGRVYRLRDPEERGRTFDRLNLAWYERLGLDRPLAAALAEQPLVTAGVGRCAVGRAPRRRDAGAELLVRSPAPGETAAAGRLLRLLLAPEMAGDAPALTTLLRRELQHVADMLEPRFGYAPALPRGVGGPAAQGLLRDGYRVVWNVTVDGRLARAGRLAGAVRAERRAEFMGTFATLDGEAERAFARFFDDPAPTHGAIVAFVTDALAAGRARHAACALCGFPTSDLEAKPLAPEALAEIRSDFPAWRPADGCCRQCADLYRARPLALREARALPGIR